MQISRRIFRHYLFLHAGQEARRPAQIHIPGESILSIELEELDPVQIDDEIEYDEKWFSGLIHHNRNVKAEIDHLLREQKKDVGWDMVEQGQTIRSE